MKPFTPEERERLRGELVAAAERDTEIIGAAHTGSYAVNRVDRWSDIDLAFAVSPDADVRNIVARWTERRYNDHRAAAHFDVWHGPTLFRVYLLENTLQVDLAFWAARDFGAIGPAFRLVFGTAAPQQSPPAPSAGDLIGMAWLYALHARSSVARGRVWQAEYMVSGMRDQILALACVRHNVPAHQGRGLDDLPPHVRRPLEATLVRSLDPAEIERAFGMALDALLKEVAHLDGGLALRLEVPFGVLRNPIVEPGGGA